MTTELTAAVESFRAFNRLHTRVAGVLKPRYMGSDLSVIEARLLYELAHRDGVLAAELQAALDLDAGFASRLLRRFEERGWIARGREADARRRPIRLTAAGRDAFDALDQATRSDTERLLEPLGQDKRATLVASLDTARGLLGEDVPWHIRTFRAGDLGMIVARQAVLYAEGYGWGRAIELLELEVVAAFLRDFKPGREQCWVAERGGRMVGAIFCVDSGDGRAQLRLLHVEPDARGLGIGDALVRTCVDFARDAGYPAIWLWTHTVLESARRIYAGNGFRCVATEVHDEFGAPEQSETWELEFVSQSK